MNILQYQDAISYIWVHIGYAAPTLKYTKRPVTDEMYPEYWVNLIRNRPFVIKSLT